MPPLLPASATVLPDEQLVARTQAGDRDAFRRIVERYQSLICSLAYNATGNLAESEDFAQETFLAGWRQIAQLREPAKLRSWLCGIARNLINNRRRRLAAQPWPAAAGTGHQELVAPDPSPSDAAIQREQEAILWQALERIPADYRQPLILFYRAHRSIEVVARDLELSEDVVRQRLSRGRKLLQREVLAFVEGTLARTAPGAMFTTSVMASLPLLAATSLTSAGMGGAAAQWTGAGLGGKLLLAFNVVAGPLLGIAAAWLGVRESFREADSSDERRLVKRYYLTIATGTVLFTLASIPLNNWAKAGGGFNPTPMLFWLALLLSYVGGVAVLATRLVRKQNRLRAIVTALAPQPAQPAATVAHEYRSRWTLLGLPLVHVRLTRRADGLERPAVGWIAIGNCAFGLLFAWGGIAAGLVSGGGISVGIVSIAAVSLGGFAIGGLAIGFCAIGGVAVGAIAAGAFAFGWIGAEGRYAIAREFALGLHAAAAHANDAEARQFFAGRPWVDLHTWVGQALLSLVWLPAVFVIWQSLPRFRRS
ncbi:RNA polymerase sigma factor [Opitutus terrae]|uniref:RNA polymerase, sigma-24 subunit, ECF subfamily n=1 Tax=Opitutus terrae (strain DSM 11246 / JCM 15787 / PB90-1) TaxID=452637 RepID=B1ZX21_OPITP|nr:sigma-70 family RNA polymerase sigma factor [Opitutus terrae]ACB75132.1 RNA polymerase, sigma-24 subunit, ECF subfamily [Opitutus terrae PB90-1]